MNMAYRIVSAKISQQVKVLSAAPVAVSKLICPMSGEVVDGFYCQLAQGGCLDHEYLLEEGNAKNHCCLCLLGD